MLVRGMIEAISDKKLKVNDLAKKYEVSDRTIQTKIKKLGFEWDSVEGKYNFVGTDESIFDKDIDEVFKKNSKTTKQLTGTFPIQKRIKKNIRTANKELASSIQKV
ncbi:HTH domain-containing protein, partial [Priestia megaterium]